MSYAKGLTDLGNGLWAWLQPDGGWGYSNAGLITNSGESVLVDTLFDEHLTDEMLRAMEASCGIRRDLVETVINTHANGDHTHGNALLTGAEIVASEASAREMEAFPPSLMAQLKAAGQANLMGEAGRYFAEIFAPFDFAGVHHSAPTRTFSGTASLDVGDTRVQLLEVGPAHTAGDILVHVPDSNTIFTGDILFIEGTPVVWAGPISNWIAACDLIEAMDPTHIVPGHGPLTGLYGVREVADYLRFVESEAHARFTIGMGPEEAAMDIGLGRYASWRDAERIAVNVDTAWREWSNTPEPTPATELFGRMAKLYYDRR
ncbi:MBL fold metallo-hydrolase [Sandaracinobacteroides hominis]|uniref:MBL fold metallo-hydrolase n=1 Tax=Sandaracinobacteroides hominis TaxID=2780086 RepID=UPI0018F48C8E|nr:MBL fold metallo-hydrolase [Sandaracinobacteroides hominis]